MEEGEEEISRKKVSKIPKWFLVAAVSIFTVLLFHGSKYLLMETIQWFLIPKKSTLSAEDTCNVTPTANTSHIVRKTMYNWDSSLLKALKFSHISGFLSTTLIGGVLADKYGTKRMFLITHLITSVWIASCPLLVQYCGGYWQLLVAWSSILGFIQGPTLPMVDAFGGQWIPRGSRTTVTAMKCSGEFLGVYIRILVARAIAAKTGQISSAFYICSGAISFLCFLWYCLCFSSPEEHPTITEEEKKMLREELGPYVAYKNKQIPWRHILTSLPVWAYIMNHAGFHWSWVSLMHQLRAYVKVVVRINIAKYFFHVVILPMILVPIVNIGLAVLCDYLLRNNKVEITAARRIYANFGCMGAGIFALSIAYTSCLQELVLVMYNISLIFLTIFVTGVTVNNLDLAPNYAGILRGLGTTFGTACAFLATYFMSFLMESNSLSDWKKAFWISLIFYVIANTFFALGSSGCEREWNIPKHLRQQKPSFEMDS